MASRASTDVVVRFIGDTGSLDKGLDGLKGRFVGVATGLKGIATASATLGAAGFLRGAIQGASDLAETTSKVGVVFGSVAPQIKQFADTAAKSIGQSKQSAMDAAATFATFGKGAGLAGEKLATFSIDLVKLASDMASFSNTTPEEAIEALGAALRGENDPIEKYGVLLNEATIQQSGLRLGLIKTTKEALTPQQKVLAAQAEIMRQTSDAQGDFRRTADGNANSQRTLAAEYANAAAELGEKFLPITQQVTQALRGALPVIENVGDTVSSVLVPGVEAVFEAGKTVVGVWEAMPGPLQYGAVALGAWQVVGDRVTETMGRMTGATRGLGDDVRTAMGAFDVGRLEGTMMVLEERLPVVGRMAQSWRDSASAGLALANTMPGLQGAMVQFGSAAKGIGAAAFEGIRTAASGLVGFLGGPWGLALAGGAVALGMFAEQSSRAKEHQARLKSAAQSVADVIAEQEGVINKSVRAKAAEVLASHEIAGGYGTMFSAAEKAGVSIADLTSAYLGDEAALRRVIDATDEYVNADGSIKKNTEEGRAAFALRGELTSLIGAKESELNVDRQVKEAVEGDTAAKDSNTAATQRNTQSADAWSAVMDAAGIEVEEGASAVDHMREAIDALTRAETMQMDTLEGYEASLDQLTESIKDNKNTLDIHTEAGRANRDALEDVAAKSRDLMLADIEAGVPMDQALKRHQDRIAALKTEATATFGANSEANTLIDTYGKVPQNIVTAIQTKGMEDVLAAMDKLSAGQYLLANNIPVTPANTRAVLQERRSRYAYGGLVGGFSPTPRADNINALLTAGEVVESNAAGDYYGRDFLVALNERKIPREMLPTFAGGGVVTVPIPVDVSKTKIPSMMVGAIPGAPGPGGPGMGWQAMWNVVKSAFPGATLNSAFRRGDPGYHGRGRAIDVGGPMAAINRWLAGAYPGSTELIYTPGINLWHGRPHTYKPATRADHYDHVHWAMSRGGLVGKPGGYKDGGWLDPGKVGVNETSKPEPVLSTSQWEDVGGLVEQLRALVAALAKNTGKVINVGGIHVANRPVDVMQQLRFAEMMAGV